MIIIYEIIILSPHRATAILGPLKMVEIKEGAGQGAAAVVGDDEDLAVIIVWTLIDHVDQRLGELCCLVVGGDGQNIAGTA